MPTVENKITASENFYNFIKQAEGLVLHPYLDTAGVPTIGYGSTMYDTGKKVTMSDPSITKEYAQKLLEWEVNNKSAVIRSLLGNTKVNQNQFDALLSLVYNIGIGGFSTSTLLRTIKKNPNDPYIKDCFLMWDKITKKGKKVVDEGLLNRRKREIALYFS